MKVDEASISDSGRLDGNFICQESGERWPYWMTLGNLPQGYVASPRILPPNHASGIRRCGHFPGRSRGRGRTAVPLHTWKPIEFRGCQVPSLIVPWNRKPGFASWRHDESNVRAACSHPAVKPSLQLTYSPLSLFRRAALLSTHRETQDFHTYPHKRLRSVVTRRNGCSGRGPLIKLY